MSRVLLIGSLAESLVNFRGDLLQQLVGAGHEVFAAAPSGPAWVDDQLRSWGVHRITMGLNRHGTSAFGDFKLLLELHRVCRRLRPDVVLSYTIKPVVYGSLAARLAGVPRIAALVTGLGFAFMGARTLRQRVVQRIARGLYGVAMRSAHVVLFQNPDDQAEFRALGLLKQHLEVVLVNGSGVNLARFPSSPPKEPPVQFLLVARLLLDKGVREYLQAAAVLHEKRPSCTCHLVGPFDSNPSAISESEVADAVGRRHIVYHGATDDVRPFLRDCHVYVLPSYREGTPRSVLEALAVGRAIITTDAPGCRETVVPGRNGVLVPVADAQALAAEMIRFADMSLTDMAAMGNESRALAEERFDVRKVNADIMQALSLNV